jgi:hypothetical protein
MLPVNAFILLRATIEQSYPIVKDRVSRPRIARIAQQLFRRIELEKLV